MTDGACWLPDRARTLRAPQTLERAVTATPDIPTMAVVGLAWASLLALLVRRDKSHAEVVFAVFCGSLSLSMLRPWLADSEAWLLWACMIGGCATCNAYWLLARALFRGDEGVRMRHVWVATAIAALIAAYRVAERADGSSEGAWTAALGGLLTLASSSVLVLAFLEAVRGWSADLPAMEKRLRIGFMAVFGGCVLVGTVTGAWAEVSPGLAAQRPTVIAVCALSILVFTQCALWLRRRHPWPRPVADDASRPPADITDEERRLAAAVLRVLEAEALYREPELKVADLAQRLGCAEYRVSRAITQGLGERNFNRLVNRYRIAHARRLLADPAETRSVLEICLDAGFASPGPFNRAFKEATGLTPSAWRAQTRARAGSGHATQSADAPALALLQATGDGGA